MNDAVLSALSLCRKAGALKMGAEAAEEALLAGAPLAVYTSDAAQRTVKRLAAACKGGSKAVPLMRTMDETQAAFGKRFAVAAIDNEGLAGLVLKKISEGCPPAT